MTFVKGPFNPHRDRNPQDENCCFRLSQSGIAGSLRQIVLAFGDRISYFSHCYKKIARKGRFLLSHSLKAHCRSGEDTGQEHEHTVTEEETQGQGHEHTGYTVYTGSKG